VLFEPQPAGRNHRIYPGAVPPVGFVTGTVDFAVVSAAKRDRKFIADFAAECPALRKSNMMSVGRQPTAKQTWLPRDEFDVIPVADSSRLRQAERAFVDRLASCRNLRAMRVRRACRGQVRRTCVGLYSCGCETF
jgi:hypothetical protein